MDSYHPFSRNTIGDLLPFSCLIIRQQKEAMLLLGRERRKEGFSTPHPPSIPEYVVLRDMMLCSCLASDLSLPAEPQASR